MKKEERQAFDQQNEEKKAYDVPSLTVYGDFTRLTHGGGPNGDDGGGFFTKA